jgi:glyceraldehyde-3-phosphate dehydrogenase (NAD(P))
MLKVCINGYGTIGKRVADVLINHPKIRVTGVCKYTPDADARLAKIKDLPLFTVKEKRPDFENAGIELNGSLEDVLEISDVVVDASPGKFGIVNKEKLYVVFNKKAIFQGGEKADVADVSFNARSNFEQAAGKDYIRVVSCNTTALSRIIKPLLENYRIENINVTLVRRGADPGDDKGSALNSVSWKAKSHHAPDVKCVLGDIPIHSTALKVPHTLMHVHFVSVDLNDKISKDAVYEIFEKENRVAVLNTAKSTAEIMERARDLGLARNDIFTVNLHMNTLEVRNNNLSFVITVPQESIAVPENVDALMAQSKLMKKDESMELTDRLLGIKRIKKDLEELFS